MADSHAESRYSWSIAHNHFEEESLFWHFCDLAPLPNIEFRFYWYKARFSASDVYRSNGHACISRCCGAADSRLFKIEVLQICQQR